MTDWLGTTTFEVDLLHQLKSVTEMHYPNGWVEYYTYDSMGRLLAVNDTHPSEKPVKTQIKKTLCGSIFSRRSLKMEKVDKSFEVWAGILELISEIQKYIAITKAYKKITTENNCNSKSSDFLDTALQAVWDQLLLDISKVFDRARTRGHENCSINLLKELLQKSASFSDLEKEAITREANQLCEKYDEFTIKDVRNKQIAHCDLEVLLNNVEKNIPSEELEAFVTHVADFFTKISTRFLNDKATIRFCPLEDTIKIYESDMRKIYGLN